MAENSRAGAALARTRFGVLALCLILARTASATKPASRAEDPDYDSDAAAGEAPATSRGAPPFAPPPAEPEAPRFEGEAVKGVVPDIDVHPWPPPVRMIVGFGVHYPLQLAGVGIGVEGYPTDFLRMSAYYSAGISGVNQFLSFSNYGQALVGVRVLSFAGSYTENVTADPNAPLDRPGRTLYQAVLPARQAVFIEAGMLSGNVPRLKCTAACAPPTNDQSTLVVVNPQLFYPMAGLRYVFNTSVASKRQPYINRELQIQVYGDVLFHPLNDSKESLLWGDLSPVHSGNVGGMVGVTFPLCIKFCIWPSLMGGYLPAPASALFGLGFGG